MTASTLLLFAHSLASLACAAAAVAAAAAAATADCLSGEPVTPESGMMRHDTLDSRIRRSKEADGGIRRHCVDRCSSLVTRESCRRERARVCERSDRESEREMIGDAYRHCSRCCCCCCDGIHAQTQTHAQSERRRRRESKSFCCERFPRSLCSHSLAYSSRLVDGREREREREVTEGEGACVRVSVRLHCQRDRRWGVVTHTHTHAFRGTT